MEQQDNYDVFLSYATPDEPVVKELARKLGLQRLSVWLDEWRLIAGEPWQEALERALESCNACVICIGPGDLGDWQTKEMRAAISRQAKEKGLRVIPVLLPRPQPGELSRQRGDLSRFPAFLREYNCIEFGETLENEEVLRRLVCGIRGVAPGPGPGEAIAEGLCPYRGLQVFDVGDALFFFGREALTQGLVDRLRTNRSGPRFLAIVGSSGSGKSSLARAGLLAALKRGDIPGSEAWPVADCKPGKEPLQSLALAFTKAFRRRDEARDEAEVSQRTQTLGKDPHALHIATSLALSDAPSDRRLVVLVDQFEEVFTCPETQCRALIDNLLYAAMAPEGQTLVVLTLRADFYERCADYQDLAKVLPSDRQSLIGPMGPDELRNAIKNPAYNAGCELDAGLADLLLRDVQAQAGSLPLLEHALLQIWQRREGRRRLTIKAYNEIGGVAGALEKHAEEVYSGFTEAEREICRRVFLRLVRVDEQGRATKRRLEIAELSPAARAVVNRLADRDSRLLTTDPEKENHPQIELAHEALLTHWERLKNWVKEDLNDLQTYRRLEEAAARWNQHQRDSSFLYRGIPLAEAEKWVQSHPGELKEEKQGFLQASLAQRDEEVDKEKRRRRLSMILLAAATATAVLVASQMYRIRKENRLNVATQVAGHAELGLSTNPLLSLLLGVEAVHLADDLPEAKGALLGALARSDAQSLGGSGIVAIAAADRRSIVTVAKGGTASLWSLDTEIPAAPAQTFHIEGSVSGLALSPDRRWLLIRDRDAQVRLQDLRSDGKPMDLPEENWLPGNPFSPDRNGRWLITHRLDLPVLHDLSTGSSRELTSVPAFWAMAYSPDGQRLAVALEGGKVEIWDLRSQDPSASRQVLPGSSGQIEHLAFSADGLWLAAAVVDGTAADAEVWPVSAAGVPGQPRPLRDCTGNKYVVVSPKGAWVFTWGGGPTTASCLWSLRGETNPAPSLLPPATKADFSPENRWLAWGEANGRVRLRDLLSPTGSVIDLAGQGHPVEFLRFTENGWLVSQEGEEAPYITDLSRRRNGEILAATPDGTRFVVGDSPQAVRVAGPGNVTPRVIKDIGPKVSIWALSSDGAWLAAGGQNQAQLWNLKDDSQGSPRTVVADLDHTITSLAFDLSHNALAVGWDNGRVVVFPMDSKGILNPPPPCETAVTALAFNPDGQWLAMADANGEVFLWNAQKKDGRKIPLGGRDRRVNTLAFSRDNRLIASGGQDGTLQIWSFDGEKPLGVPVVWQGHPGAIRSLSFTAGGKELITTGANDTVRHWPLRTEDLIRLACQKAGRNLTKEEWESNAPPGEPFKEGTPCGGLESARR